MRINMQYDEVYDFISHEILPIYISMMMILLVAGVLFMFFKIMISQKFFLKNTKFMRQLEKEIQEYDENGVFLNSCGKLIRKNIHQTKHMIALQGALENNIALQIEARPYIEEMLLSYKKKSDYEQAFYAYVVAMMEYSEVKVDEKYAQDFLDFLDSDSLYIFFNGMMAIYKFGEVYLMLEAIDKMNERPSFYHKKLFVDGMMTFQGDFEELRTSILERFYTYDEVIQENLIDFFRMQNIDVKELCHALVKEDNTAVDVRYAAIRYLQKYKDDKTREILEFILREDSADWVRTVLALQGLHGYYSESLKNCIREYITHKNWHIRFHAARYLFTWKMEQKDIEYILRKQDSYANDLLLYWAQDNAEIMEKIDMIMDKIGDEKYA